MDFENFQTAFETLLGVKASPNAHEEALFERAQRTIGKIGWIPGIRMIAIVNSLSMYATHRDSDIDLFIITEKNRMWLARICITAIFWVLGVWRHNEEIAGNFCLSFWIEESAIDMKKIAISDDIYLYYWMYFMKPIVLADDFWNEFLQSNTEYRFSPDAMRYLTYSIHRGNPFAFSRFILDAVNGFFRYFGEMKTMINYRKKGRPQGVIISRNILKFHDHDRRSEIRESILSQTQ